VDTKIKLNCLLLGSGGRESALAWKFSQSTLLRNLYIAPGNAGTGAIGINVPLHVLDFEAIKRFVLEMDIDIVVVGPEEPLVKGIHDFFLADNLLNTIPVIGPCRAGAKLEGSKDFAKSFMIKHSIPTAAYRSFSLGTITDGIKFLELLSPPYVLKADGLAAGKGVAILTSLPEAKEELKAMLRDSKFGEASGTVVIEEFLSGIELSVFVLTDGKDYVLLPEAKDYKRIGDGDTGPNTGGMGSISPVPFADKVFMDKVITRIIQPTINGLQDEKIPFSGFIFFGLISVSGEPYVIEYNVRLGDPETEVVVPRISSDLLELLWATARGKLASVSLDTDPRPAACVMLVSEGYPGEYTKGLEINGLNDSPESLLFHAGTYYDEITGVTHTNGGRVIAISSIDSTMKDALANCYNTAGRIKFNGVNFRKDIGKDIEKLIIKWR
jgi:phosphoribosylamine---glycine ligase